MFLDLTKGSGPVSFDMLGAILLVVFGLLLGFAGPYYLRDIVSQIGFTFSSGKTFAVDGVVFMHATGVVLTLAGTVWLLSSRSVEIVATPEKHQDGDDPPDS